MEIPAGAAATPMILDGLLDQRGEHWISYGTNRKRILFSLAELQINPTAVFSRLPQVGKTALTNKAKDDFRREVEAFGAFKAGRVLSRSGWTDGMFRCGDGTVIKARADERSFASVESATLKFDHSGSFENWRNGVGNIVCEQPLPLILLSYAFVGAFIDFAPTDIQNPIVELIGAKQTGKTTMATAAGSVWGGNPDSSTGFGESWDTTITNIDTLANDHRGHLLVLDEANLSGHSRRAQVDFLRTAVFKLTQSGSRQRFTDPTNRDHARVVTLSTGNTRLCDLISGQSAADEATLSRVFTIEANRPHGIFDFVPRGYSTAEEASVSLQRGVSYNFGFAGRLCVQELANRYWRDPQRLRSDIADCYDRYLRLPAIARLADPRHAKVLALAGVANQMAMTFNAIPSDWGSIDRAISSLDFETTPASVVPTCAMDQLRSYIENHQGHLIHAGQLATPLSADAFDRTPGVWLDQQLLLIPTSVFQRSFPNPRMVLNELRRRDCLEGEAGKQPRCCRKVPSRVCEDRGRRGYFVRLA